MGRAASSRRLTSMPIGRRGCKAELGQDGITPTNRGLSLEDMRKPQAFGQDIERRAGIGDRDEQLAGFFDAQRRSDPVPEVVEENIGLQRAARFRGDHEERVRKIDCSSDRAYLSGIRAVEHMKVRPSRLSAERFRQSFRPELDPPMPNSTTSLKPRGVRLAGEVLQRIEIVGFIFRDPKPPHPLVLVAARPKRLVARPKAPDFSQRAPDLPLARESRLHVRGTRANRKARTFP